MRAVVALRGSSGRGMMTQVITSVIFSNFINYQNTAMKAEVIELTLNKITCIQLSPALWSHEFAE